MIFVFQKYEYMGTDTVLVSVLTLLVEWKKLDGEAHVFSVADALMNWKEWAAQTFPVVDLQTQIEAKLLTAAVRSVHVQCCVNCDFPLNDAGCFQTLPL